jgi:hypothetical protein
MWLKTHLWNSNKPIRKTFWNVFWQQENKVDISVIPKWAAL